MTRSRRRSSLTDLLGVAIAVALLAVAGAGCTSAAAALSVGALQVAADKEMVLAGDAVIVTAQVENTGTLAGTFEVTLTVDGSVESRKDVELEAGGSATVRFVIEAGPPGDYEVRVGDEIATLHVSAAVAAFSVGSLTIETDEDAIRAGEDVVISAEVRNTGTLAGVYEAALSVGGSVESRKDVELAAGRSETVRFIIEAGPPGDYEIRLGAVRTMLRVPEPASLEVSALLVTPNPAEKGDELDVAVTVANSGGLTGTHPVELVIDGKVAGRQDATVAGGERTTIHFPIPAPKPGRHSVTVDGLEADLVVWNITRPASGTVLVNKLGGGMGRLKLENGNDRDAVVVLAKSSAPSKTLLAVYLRAGKSRTITGIKDGTYIVFYTTGERWDSASKQFTNEPVHRRFEDPIRFKTTRTSTRITFSIWTISLYVTSGGNAPTDRVDDDEFPTVP